MSTSTDIKGLMRRFESAMNARRLDLLDELIAPDVVRHCEATPGLEVTNIDQLKDFLKADASAFPDNKQTFEHILVDSTWLPCGPRTRELRRGRWALSRRRENARSSASRASSASARERSRNGGSRGMISRFCGSSGISADISQAYRQDATDRGDPGRQLRGVQEVEFATRRATGSWNTQPPPCRYLTTRPRA